MSWNDGLKPPHLNVAAYPDSPLRVLAGPGTGKTFAIMRRVSRLLEQGENPKDILLVTFTRMAAKQLVGKVSELGAEGGEDVIATTLHSFSFSMLQREQVIEATNRTPRTLLKFEMNPLLHDLKNQGLGGIRDLRKNIKAYESAWARLQRDEAGWAQSDEEKNFEKILILWLKFHESMLVGELIPIALQYLRDNPASPYRMKFKHVIVDEYQDLNKAEQVLIDLLAEGAKLSIVGDDDQSIYAFKYAHPEGIKDFDLSHSNTHDEILVECRRCPKLIIKVAKELISRNRRYLKELHEMPDSTEGEIRILQWGGQRKEAEGIAKIVKYYLEKGGFSPGEVSILAQRKNIAEMISEELQKLSLKSVNYYNDDLLNSDFVKERFTLLNLIANPEDRVALRYWLGRENANWYGKPYSILREHCEHSGDSPRKALEKMRDGTLHLNHCERLNEQYSELIKNEADIKDKVGRELVNRLFPEDIDECSELRKVALGLVEKDTTPEQLLERLREELTHPDIPEERAEISIMSLHKAKGLEADLVIISSCIEGLIPLIDEEKTPYEQQQELEENRRLFYVGITRTKKVLILSSILYMNVGTAKQMKIKHTMINKGLAKVQSSSFLRELGPSCPKPIKGEEFIEILRGRDV
jgi:DNA helicase-2/ATP-dependent DNA helicase PcrA